MFQRRIVVIGGSVCDHHIAGRLQMIGLDALSAMDGQPAFDWGDPATWPDAIRGATALCIANTAQRAAEMVALAIMAADMGVEHIALYSIRGGRGVSATEKAIRRAPLDHTFIRASRLASWHEIADAAGAALCDPAYLNRTCTVPARRACQRHRAPPVAGSASHPMS